MDTVDNGEHLAFRGTKNAPYYCDMILSFREYVQPEKFEEIVGKAFFAHLTCGLNSTDG